MHALRRSSGSIFLSLVSLIGIGLAAAPSRAQSADQVSFDDSSTTRITGDDVQEALESADAELDALALQSEELASFHEGLDDDAGTVYLRQDCTGQRDCFTDLEDVETWLWNTRNPSASSPVVVDIGPGSFDTEFICPSGRGHVTLRGAGRDRTTLAGDLSVALATINANGCVEMGFQDLKVTSPLHGVIWVGGGSSRWTNVDVVAENAAWYDWLCASSPGEHFVFGSTWWGERIGWFAECDLAWIYGSDVAVLPTSSSSFSSESLTAVRVGSKGDVRVFGSSVRVGTAGISSVPALVAGVFVGGVSTNSAIGVPGGRGTFHMHGGIVSVVAANLTGGADVIGLRVDRLTSGTASAHTLDTAFNVTPGGSGTATRLEGPAMSPQLWGAMDAPPDIESERGADLFVETDCDSSGDCDAAGTETHLMVYRAECSSSNPWFDTVTGACRQ